jgi:DNA-binding NarL/FixJ family response regulator
MQKKSLWNKDMKIRIVVADDHQIVRQGLRTLLATEPDMEVVAEADNGRKTLQLVKDLSPQVVIMDISMPDLNGIEATRQLLAESPDIKVIALSMHSDSLFVFNMLKAGASGYLLKDCALEQLVTAIRTVMANRTYLSPGISDILIKDFVQGGPLTQGASAFSLLTTREREVLQLMAEGRSTSQIASSLFVSVKTVETHRKQLMDKLGIYSVAGLTKYAVREGLTTLET